MFQICIDCDGISDTGICPECGGQNMKVYDDDDQPESVDDDDRPLGQWIWVE